MADTFRLEFDSQCFFLLLYLHMTPEVIHCWPLDLQIVVILCTHNVIKNRDIQTGETISILFYATDNDVACDPLFTIS